MVLMVVILVDGVDGVEVVAGADGGRRRVVCW